MGTDERGYRTFYTQLITKYEEDNMETIKSYLETMFANMPNTPEVIRAKTELLGMMEDKYNELIQEGKSENEAVGVCETFSVN